MTAFRIRTVKEGLPPGYLCRVEIRNGYDCQQHAVPKVLKLNGNRYLRRFVDFDGGMNLLGGGLRIGDFFKTKKSALADYVEIVDAGWYAVEGGQLRKLDGEPPRPLADGRLVAGAAPCFDTKKSQRG